MSELSPRGQVLLRATRAALRPNGDDRERVLASLRERIGVAAPPAGAGQVVGAAQASRTIWAIAAAALIGVCVGGGAVAAAVYSGRTQVAAPSLPPSVGSASLVPALASGAPPLATSAAAPPPTTSAAVPIGSLASRRDRLAEEVAILSQAAKDLRAGRAANALDALNEHQRKFPGGLLTQERRAAKAEALCSLGRFSEADAELSTLARTSPQSPLTVRAREHCKARSTRPR